MGERKFRKGDVVVIQSVRLRAEDRKRYFSEFDESTVGEIAVVFHSRIQEDGTFGIMMQDYKERAFPEECIFIGYEPKLLKGLGINDIHS